MLRATPATWAHFLPGYCAEQIVMNGILAPSFDETRSLLIAVAWLAVLGTAATLLYQRTTRAAPRNDPVVMPDRPAARSPAGEDARLAGGGVTRYPKGV